MTPNVLTGAFTVRIFKSSSLLSSKLLAYWSNATPQLFYPSNMATGTAAEGLEGYPIPYDDDDSASQLHLQVTNNDTAAHTYTVTVEYDTFITALSPTITTPQFTTGIGIGGAAGTGNSITLYGTTSGTVLLRAAAIANTTTLVFPTTAGAANNVIVTDGSGNLSWTGTPQFTRLGVAAAADGAVPLLVSAASGQFLKITGATTGNQYARASNTGADLLWGIESSAGGTLFVGASAYASVLGTINSTSLQFATNNTVQMTIASSGSIGVGGTTNASSVVTIGQGATWTGAAGNSSGALLINPTLNPGANNSEYGIVIQPTLQKAGSGTHPNMMGITIGLAFGAGASAVTDTIGIDISSFSAPASTTNATGLRVAAPTGATNNYAIHATSGSVVFDTAGPHSIGTSPNANIQLFLAGSFSLTSAGEAFGINTNLSAFAGASAVGISLAPNLIKAGSGNHPLLAGQQVALSFTAGAATVTDAAGIDISTFAAPASTTNATGLRVSQPSSATNNYAAQFLTSGGAQMMRIQDVASNYSVVIQNQQSTAGTSNGLAVIAGTNASDVAFQVSNQSNGSAFLRVRGDGLTSIVTGTFNIQTGGSTTISTGVGSVKMSTGNPATNAAWIPIAYAGTTYYVAGYTTNAP